MSMIVVLVKVLPSLHQRIVDSQAQLLGPILDGQTEQGFSCATDVFDELEYRDLDRWASDASNPFYQLLNDGDVLVDGYDWNQGPPLYYPPNAVRTLLGTFQAFDAPTAYDEWELPDDEEEDPHWHYSAVIDFLQRAVNEKKGLILGIS